MAANHKSENEIVFRDLSFDFYIEIQTKVIEPNPCHTFYKEIHKKMAN